MEYWKINLLRFVLIIIFCSLIYIGVVWSFIPMFIGIFVLSFLYSNIIYEYTEDISEVGGTLSLLGIVIFVVSILTTGFFIEYKEIKSTEKLKVEYLGSNAIVTNKEIIKDEMLYWQCKATNCISINKVTIKKEHPYNTLFDRTDDISYEILKK